MRIIIADDDFPIRDWIASNCRAILDEKNVEIITAANGEIAFNEYNNKGADIIFADIRMPVMDGLELTEKIREKNKDVYLVILSSYDDFNYARTAFRNNVNEYILKTEITNEYLKNILERGIENINLKRSENEEKEDFYSFEELMEEYIKYNTKEEKLSFMAEHNIKRPKEAFFCIADCSLQKKHRALKLIQEENVYKLFSLRAESANISFFCISGDFSMLYQFQKINLFVKRMSELNEEHLICYGKIRRDPENILYYAQEALRGLNYSFYSDNRIIYTESIREQIKKYDEKYNELTNCYSEIKAIKDNKDASLEKKISEFFDIVEKKQILNIKDIKRLSSRIAEMIYGDIFTDESEKISKEIGQASKLNDLRKTLKKCCSESIERYTGGRAVSANINNALKYIYKNYAVIESMTEVAEEVGLNPEYFSRVFKEETGINFSVFLNNYRLERAEKLLLYSDKKLYEIAEQVGFSSLSYFSRKFKEKFDKSPFEYRQ